MIKGLATDENGNIVVMVGLSFENLRRFREEAGDTFIRITGAEMKIPFDIMIFSGETEELLAAQLMQPNTKLNFHVDEETKQ